MDHLINQFNAFIEFDFNHFYEEWNTGEYEKIIDCPTYESLYTTIKSVNILRKYMGWEALSIKKMISDKEQ